MVHFYILTCLILIICSITLHKSLYLQKTLKRNILIYKLSPPAEKKKLLLFQISLYFFHDGKERRHTLESAAPGPANSLKARLCVEEEEAGR